MSYLETYGVTEQEFDAVMEEAHEHFSTCNATIPDQQNDGDEIPM